MPHIHDCAIRNAVGADLRRAHERRGRVFDRVYGRGEADTKRALLAQRVEAGERQHQVAAALVAHQRVQLVDDHGAHVSQQRAAALGREHQVQRFRRRDQDVRRVTKDRRAGGLRRVACAQRGADLRRRDAHLSRDVTDAIERRLQVALDIAAQRLQRRDVDDIDAIRQSAVQPALHQRIDARKERRQRLAGAGRRGHQRIAPGGDRVPAGELRACRRLEAALEPATNRGVEGVECRHDRGLSVAQSVSRSGAIRPRRPSDSVARAFQPARCSKGHRRVFTKCSEPTGG